MNTDVTELVNIEKTVIGVEKESIRRRWDFGKRFLELAPVAEYGQNIRSLHSEYKKLVMSLSGVKKSELDHRVKLYRKFSTEDEIAHAAMEWPNWTLLRQNALYAKKNRTIRMTPKQMLDRERQRFDDYRMTVVSLPDLLVALNSLGSLSPDGFPREISIDRHTMTMDWDSTERKLVFS